MIVECLAFVPVLYRIPQICNALGHTLIISTSCRTVHGEVVTVVS